MLNVTHLSINYLSAFKIVIMVHINIQRAVYVIQLNTIQLVKSTKIW